jgi:membrane protease YdiL (CAAX protease family)
MQVPRDVITLEKRIRGPSAGESDQMQEIAVVQATSSSPAATPKGSGANLWFNWGIGACTWLILVLVVGRVMKLFRTDSIVGPERLGHNESGWLLMSNLGVGIAAGFSVPMLFGPAVAKMTPDQRLVVLNLAVYVVGFVALLVVSRMWRGEQTARLGLRPSKIGIGLIGGITALAIIDPVVIVTGVGVEFVFKQLRLPLQTHPMLTVMGEIPKRSWLFAASVSTACLVGPLTEELVFRGMLQTALGRGFAVWFDRRHADAPLLLAPVTSPVNSSNVLSYEPPRRFTGTSASSRWAAVIVTSLAFAAIHQSKAFFVPLFVLSVGFGYLYERTGNLWATVACHGLFNLTNTLIFLNQ